MASFSKGTSFQDGVTGDVTAAKLHALVDAATPVAGLVTDRTAKTSVAGADLVLLSDSADSNNLKKVSITNFANNLPTAVITNGTVTTLAASTLTSNLSGGTYSGTLNSTTGTVTNLNSTSGTVATLNSTTGTITNLNSTSGTVATLNSTSGTVATLNSTTGTITNLTTTLAGDLTISTGTATVSTRVAVVNTAQEYTAAHNFNATSLTITSGTIPWDLSANQVAKLEVTTNSTLNTPTNPVDGATYMLVVTQGTGGNNTLSFSTAYKFPGGIVPSLSTGSADVDVLAFVSNGTVLYGVTSQDFS